MQKIIHFILIELLLKTDPINAVNVIHSFFSCNSRPGSCKVSSFMVVDGYNVFKGLSDPICLRFLGESRQLHLTSLFIEGSKRTEGRKERRRR